MGSGNMVCVLFAAWSNCLRIVLHRDYGFGQGRCHKVLSALDAEMSPGGQLTIQGAIDQVYDEIGLALNFDEPFDRIEKKEAKKP